MSLGQMVVELSLDGNQFTVNLKKADGQLAQFIQGAGQADQAVRRAERSTRSWGHALRDGVIVLSLIRSAIQNVSDAAFGWQRAIVGVNAEVQRSIQLMKSFSKETNNTIATQEALADVQMLMNKASNAPFQLSAITDTFVKLRVAGVEPVRQSLDNLMDAVAAFGGSNENLKRAGVAIQQMAGKGVISMEELRQQLGEAVPTAIQNMADGLGVSYAKLVKEISLGRVKSEPALIAMMREMELSFTGSAQNMMNTWGGAVARFETEAKKLALVIGGLGEDGYAENSYMSTLIDELNNFTDLMADPSIQAAAKDFGQSLAEVVKAAADGIRFIVEYRREIGDLAKAFLILYAATKTMSIARALISSVGTAVLSGVGAFQAYTKAGMGAQAALNNLNPTVARATQEWAKKGGAVGAAGRSLGTIGGVLAGVTGPLGMVAASVAAGALAWWDYRRSVEATIDSVVKAKGLTAGSAELALMAKEKKTLEDEIASLQRRLTPGANDDFGRYNNEQIEAQIRERQRKIAQMVPAMAQAEMNVMSQAVQTEVRYAESQIARGAESLNKTYTAAMKERQDVIKAADADGKRSLEEQKSIDSLKLAAEKAKLDGLYKLHQEQQERLQKEVDTGVDSRTNAKLSTADVEARKKAILELTFTMGQLGDRQIELMESATSFNDTIMDGAGGAMMKYDPLKMLLDSLRIKVGKLGAKVDETNPYLAQMQAVIENMGENKSPKFDEYVAQITTLAGEAWKTEQQIKKLKDANTGYGDSMERVSQIEKVVTGKLNKAENENPWLKASADSERYRQELGELATQMEEYRVVALELNDVELAAKIEQSADALANARKKVEQYSVQDTAKRMNEQSRDINDSLLTQSQAVEAQYQRQLKWAQDYYNEHKALIAADAEASAAYYDYLKALQDKHERDTESGLQKWIRENQDASEKYKSLWGSAMDSFSDTVADGLMEGKFQIADFVQYVLKELIKIQIAKAVAGIATTVASAWGGGAAGNTSSAAASSGYTTNGYAGAYGFANGGIMTEWGKTKLKQYANGGIAREPQLAVFGEGSMAEAYVPLPDGRTIPVTLQGNLNASAPATQQASAPQVMVNVINQSGQNMDAEQTGGSFNGEQYVVDVVLKAVNRPGPLRDAIKG